MQIQQKHRLVTNGPYRFVRHPGYSAYLLMVLGVAVRFASLVAFAALILFLLSGLLYRMNVEERLLVEVFCDMYRQYQNRTKRLIPGVW